MTTAIATELAPQDKVNRYDPATSIEVGTDIVISIVRNAAMLLANKAPTLVNAPVIMTEALQAEVLLIEPRKVIEVALFT